MSYYPLLIDWQGMPCLVAVSAIVSNDYNLIQGYVLRSSASAADYEEKYAYSSSIERNAYNYEDLQNVVSVFNEEAGPAELRELAKAYTFRAAVTRRTGADPYTVIGN